MGWNGNNGTARQHSIFEELEPRQLMSTVNVVDYGANPNDGNDDTAAVRAAIDDSHSGDTIYFPAGTYDVGDSITLAGDRTYEGDHQKSVIQGDGGHHLFKIHDNNITIDSLTFDGKPIFIDHDNNQMVDNININNNVFHVHAYGDNYNGITFTTGLSNSQITNNTFDPIDGDNGIYGYNWAELRIANNQFLDGQEGVHVIDFTDQSHNLTVEQNYFSGLTRMGVEIQGGGSDTLVQDNFYEKPAMTSNFDDNSSTFAYSIIADRSRNTVVRRNTSIAPERPDGTGVRIIFELGGDNVQCYDNYSVGGNQVAILNTSNNGSIHDNNFSGYLEGPGAYDGRSPGAQIYNNGPDVQLSWHTNRGRPGPDQTFDGVSTRQASSPAKNSSSSSTSSSSTISRKVPKLLSSDKWIYLTDLRSMTADSGWGPVEVNQSNGGKRAGDGTPISIDGKTYERGLGVAIDSVVTYNINGRYTKFFSDVGIDDDTNGQGSMDFQVWGDGKKLYDSGVLTAKDGRKGVSVYVKGVHQLKLVTTNGGDGSRNDLGDWAAPRLVPV